MIASASLWTARASPSLLASTSATRRDLLRGAGSPVEIEAPGVDERAVEAPRGRAARRRRPRAPARGRKGARRVAAAIPAASSSAPTRCSRSTARSCTSRADGAARGAARAPLRPHARTPLRRRLARDGAILGGRLRRDARGLTMRPLDRRRDRAYLDVAGADVLRSVGGYRVEGLGIHLFERIEGDHSTILGLPLLPLLAALRASRLPRLVRPRACRRPSSSAIRSRIRARR